MDRIIEVKVCGSHLTKDAKKAGTKGESNATRLRITFDENWEDFAKQVVFWDAYGQNPVRVVLTIQLIEDISKSTRVYLVPIPKEAMARAGWMTFVIKGSLDNKNFVCIKDTLEVDDSPDILEPIDPTPTEVEQIQAEIEGIKGDLQSVETARRESTENARIAKESADRAVATVGKSSYIGENGNWYAWDEENLAFYDTGIKAQSGSIVYMGENPPEDADVWIDEDTTFYIRNESGKFVPIPTIKGKDGKSAYEQAVESGYKGTPDQFTTLLNNLTYTIEAEHLSDTNNPHKVTAHQVGALSITGGTLTGKTLYFDNGNSCLSGGQNYMLMDVYGAPKDSNNFRRIELRGGTQAINGALVLKERINGEDKTYSLYGTHNKPKTSDIGAVSKQGDTMSGPLVFDKNNSWGQIVMNTPSGNYRAYEAADNKARIDVRDGETSEKRRYFDVYPPSQCERSKALRLGQAMDGESTESYVLHTDNINDFVASSGSYEGNGNETNEIKIRKTTVAVIICGNENDRQCYSHAVLVRGAAHASTADNCQTDLTWYDDKVVIKSYSERKYHNNYNWQYHYALIG